MASEVLSGKVDEGRGDSTGHVQKMGLEAAAGKTRPSSRPTKNNSTAQEGNTASAGLSKK